MSWDTASREERFLTIIGFCLFYGVGFVVVVAWLVSVVV